MMVSNSFLTRKMHLNDIKDRTSETQHGVAVCLDSCHFQTCSLKKKCCRFHHYICISLICFELSLSLKIVKTLSLANIIDCFSFEDCIFLAKFQISHGMNYLSNTCAAAFTVMYVKDAAKTVLQLISLIFQNRRAFILYRSAEAT